VTEAERATGTLNPELALRVFEFGASRPGQVDVVSDDARGWMALEESRSTFAFAEVEGDELRILPFFGDVDSARALPFVQSIDDSWLDGFYEIVIHSAAASELESARFIDESLESAREHWYRTAAPSVPVAQPGVPAPSTAPGAVALVTDSTGTDAEAPPVAEITRIARLRADISPEWSWASANARIPQVAGVVVELGEAAEHARLYVTLRDADIVFGTKVVHDGALSVGQSDFGAVHVPLSTRVMSQVDERLGATCEIILEVGATVVARIDEAVDLHPRDLWNLDGDAKNSGRYVHLRGQASRLRQILDEEPQHADRLQILQAIADIQREIDVLDALSGSLLAAFVRPNHPAVAVVARDAARLRGELAGESSFHAFQLPERTPEQRRLVADGVESSITAIYESLRNRKIAYSEPPAGWDYAHVGQRIRDHGEVANGGLATCMDTTVLAAAVIEDVGLRPLLVLIPEHIFVGYWRHNPDLSGRDGTPDWYPRRAIVDDVSVVSNLVEAGYLGVIESTALTVAKDRSADDARFEALRVRLASGLTDDDVTLIDVAAARRLGVSPLPAVIERADGNTEIFEYRVDAPAAATFVDSDAPETAVRERRVDVHPPRYRTWKSSLFSLNATNALLNLGNNARVQPVVLPTSSLGELEDMLNQDKSFVVRSAYSVPEVWAARSRINARQLLDSQEAEDLRDLHAAMRDRNLFVQRFGRASDDLRAVSQTVTIRELRTISHNAKTAREERGMNPLYLCLGILRWQHSAGKTADAPLILVPVNLVGSRGGQEFTLSLDATQQTTTNAALIEWLRREHGLTIPGLAEPIADRAGIDVDAVIAEVRDALLGHRCTLQAQVIAEARLATLDLSAFRMWQDLSAHADRFLERPMVRHLVETPTEEFHDAAAMASTEPSVEEVEQLETPIPADSTQKRAVLWARQGRTFVLQGPPGTGKSQTITNMVAECVLAGMRVLFVAEKGTALAVVQRRLDDIGLSPFTLNLHHEGSNSVEVRASLQRALNANVNPDDLAMDGARRRLRNARFELTQYPASLHARNAAGHSAYSARDELLVLGEGTVIPVPPESVAHHAESLETVLETFRDVQRWTSAARVREHHPWRFAGVGAGDPFDVDLVRGALEQILVGVRWADVAQGELRAALEEIKHPRQLVTLGVAANPALPRGAELGWVLDVQWVDGAPSTLAGCEQAVEAWRPALRGFSHEVIDLDLPAIASAFDAANASGFLGRKGRQTAAVAALAAIAPAGMEVTAASAPDLLESLIAARSTAAQIRASLAAIPGFAGVVPSNPFAPGAFGGARARLAELSAATSGLRGSDDWTVRVRALAEAGQLSGEFEHVRAFADAWATLMRELVVQEDDLAAWLHGGTLNTATRRHEDEWKRDAAYERLLGLQQWCALVRRVECMRDARLENARADLLNGNLPADGVEDALARGIAAASLAERTRTSGLDRFDAVAHDDRVEAYAAAQAEVRTQWVTDAPHAMLERRGAGGRGAHTGGLERELEKTTRRLGTRAILRKFGDAVQQLTPLVLASPASAVDLIDPQLMEFDLVIFDEASQITVPEAIGALGRARAAIIVGDSKQMPPTRRVGGAASDEEIEDADADEILEDQESILSECELARVPTLSLSWHYRSQDEQLIAFSNRKYYKGDLSSFPTPTLLSSETGIEFRRVAMPGPDSHAQARGYTNVPARYEDGRYLRAGSKTIELAGGIRAGANTNPAEAFAVVDAVRGLIATAGERKPSIGIVTFNERQRELIEDLLIQSNDRGIRAAMDEQKMGRNDVLFVKALEQVQGDERDIIIFSVAFSKQANGKIPTNFGPLSNSGGERRLNVAVTRARRKDIVFCSFDPADLDVEGSAYDGPKHFKDFLIDAARSGGTAIEAPGRVAIRDRHRDDIAEALRAAGLHVMTDVGMSNFRLDLVLARPEAPDRPLVPVLLDGESWTRRSTVSDRDVLPLEVLRGLMGWPVVVRIWWPMWMQNRETVVAQILEQMDAAEEAFGALDAGRERYLEASDALPAGPTPESAAEVSAGETALESTQFRSIDVGVTEADLGRPVEAVVDEPAFDVAEPAVAAESAGRGAVEPAGASRGQVFVPAHANVVGSRDVLDDLPRRSSVAAVRSQILDVIDYEGPVELTRLTRIVARRFGLNAVRAARAEEIARLVPRDRLKKSRVGAFARPEGLDPQAWEGYRSADKDGSRSLDEVAPEEIRNAMIAVRQLAPTLDEEGVLRRTAEVFGIVRLGALVKARLSAVYRSLPE
jgi:hypothetical protein